MPLAATRDRKQTRRVRAGNEPGAGSVAIVKGCCGQRKRPPGDRRRRRSRIASRAGVNDEWFARRERDAAIVVELPHPRNSLGAVSSVRRDGDRPIPPAGQEIERVPVSRIVVKAPDTFDWGRPKTGKILSKTTSNDTGNPG